MSSTNGRGGASDLPTALDALRRGEFVLLFDGEKREAETDLLCLARHASPRHVARLRGDGGGLVFLAVGALPAERLGLPFMHDVLAQAAERWPVLGELVPRGLPYDARSSFSLWVNHRETYTGITDVDRSKTLREFARLCEEAAVLSAAEAQARFAARFRSPGHVPLCVAARGMLHERRGHTELAVALAEMASETPCLVGCEMMDAESGRALSKGDALKYASRNGLAFLEGSQVVEAHTAWSSARLAAARHP